MNKKKAGRPKGRANKNTGQLRDMILGALNAQPGGGVGYLKRQAKVNPGPFMTLLGKVLPTQITNEPENPFRMILQEIKSSVPVKHAD